MTSEGAPGLQDLLHPIEPREFLRDYWGKQPLFVPSADRGKFATLFDMDRFQRAVRREGVVELRGSFDSGATYFTARGVDVDTLVKGGATVCADHLEQADEGLRACRDAVVRELRYPGNIDIRGYLS